MNTVILVIDNSPTVRKILQVELEREGFSVILLSDGHQTYQWLHSPDYHQPALIFTEIRLPRISGYSVIRTLRGIPSLKQIPVVVLSGRAGMLDKLRALLAGATAHLAKPFRNTDITNIAHFFVTQTQLLDEGNPISILSESLALSRKLRTSLSHELPRGGME